MQLTGLQTNSGIPRQLDPHVYWWLIIAMKGTVNKCCLLPNTKKEYWWNLKTLWGCLFKFWDRSPCHKNSILFFFFFNPKKLQNIHVHVILFAHSKSVLESIKHEIYNWSDDIHDDLQFYHLQKSCWKKWVKGQGRPIWSIDTSKCRLCSWE